MFQPKARVPSQSESSESYSTRPASVSFFFFVSMPPLCLLKSAAVIVIRIVTSLVSTLCSPKKQAEFHGTGY